MASSPNPAPARPLTRGFRLITFHTVTHTPLWETLRVTCSPPRSCRKIFASRHIHSHAGSQLYRSPQVKESVKAKESSFHTKDPTRKILLSRKDSPPRVSLPFCLFPPSPLTFRLPLPPPLTPSPSFFTRSYNNKSSFVFNHSPSVHSFSQNVARKTTKSIR